MILNPGDIVPDPCDHNRLVEIVSVNGPLVYYRSTDVMTTGIPAFEYVNMMKERQS